MSHQLLTRAGDYDRRAIHARAVSLHQAALTRGDDGAAAALPYWLSYVWRAARGQRERAAPALLAAMARRVVLGL